MTTAQTSTSTNALADADSVQYEIRSIPGRGRGLVARSKIARGSRILIEEPLIVTRSMPPELLEPIVATKLKSLSKDQQRQFLSLHNGHPGKHPFSGILKTNALPCGSGSPVGAVYATICFINHSCLPNAHNNWNPDTEKETIHAIRSIQSGDEITICYAREGTSTVRRAELKDAFGFDCACTVCALPRHELQASDARLLRIQELDEMIGDPVRMMRSPISGIKNCRLLLNLLEEEHGESGGARYARLFYDAFQISVAHGDAARAAVFADRAYHARLTCEGDDSPSTRKMQDLMKDPTLHQNFGAYSARWKSKKGAIPKDLDEGQFEQWLWRESK